MGRTVTPRQGPSRSYILTDGEAALARTALLWYAMQAWDRAIEPETPTEGQEWQDAGDHAHRTAAIIAQRLGEPQ